MIARPEGIILDRAHRLGEDDHAVFDPGPHQPEGVNITDLEDPVEYPMNMVRQTSVNEAAKLDFATGIRSLMRQDPTSSWSAIRDSDTAEMAFARP